MHSDALQKEVDIALTEWNEQLCEPSGRSAGDAEGSQVILAEGSSRQMRGSQVLYPDRLWQPANVTHHFTSQAAHSPNADVSSQEPSPNAIRSSATMRLLDL